LEQEASYAKKRVRKGFLIDKYNSRYMFCFFLYFLKEVKKERVYITYILERKKRRKFEIR